MGNLRHTTNELLVGLFNYILYIEERNLKKRGIELSMNDVHILENIKKASDNSMSHIAARLMVTQGTLTTNVTKAHQQRLCGALQKTTEISGSTACGSQKVCTDLEDP
ncbi:MAG: hypothetical protein ACLVJ6_16815 [Merdibacter sp.]